MKKTAEEIKSRTELTGRLTEAALDYQRILGENPRHPQALVGMSLVALASSQFEAAVRMATAAVNAEPAMEAAWIALGQSLKAVGRIDEAEEAYGRALGLNGLTEVMEVLARTGLGELKTASGRPKEAMREFEWVLKRRPAQVAAHMGLGNAFAIQNRNEEALEQYHLALGLRPRHSEAEFAIGFVLARMGREKEAERHYRRALVLRPDFAAAWMNLGALLREQGREVFAEAALQRAVELRPDLVAGWVNLALLKREYRRPEEAEADLRKAFALNPCQVETQIAWCQFRASEGDTAGAWQWLRWALARQPDHSEAVNMHGILLHNEGRYAEAAELFERAEALGNRGAASNRGNSLLDMGRTDEALRAHQAAVERDPNSAGAKYNLALTRLRLGDWKQGWPEYEARRSFREIHRSPMIFRRPRWQGEPLEGRRVLLHSEQGLGDSIQFCRYAPLVAARGGRVIVQVHAPAARLLQTLAVVGTGQAKIAQLGIQPPEFDLECPLLSLPAVFGSTIETVPWFGAYLSANHEDARKKRAAFPDFPFRNGDLSARTLRVGVAWAGNPRYRADHLRSIKLQTLVPLLRTSEITWISLQKGEVTEQLAGLPDDISLWDGSSQDRDLAETAALVATLDLVVTTDTCIAHLAGAMAKPVWILLPYLSDWRWMQDRESTPWYPTARLFRQRSAGDWAEVVERVRAEVRRLCTAQSWPMNGRAHGRSRSSRLIPA